jgi:RND superfamily putative drug exporter
MALVPAAMVLLGDANWWLPRWLDRILPTVDFERPMHTETPTPVGLRADRSSPERESDALTVG